MQYTFKTSEYNYIIHEDLIIEGIMSMLISYSDIVKITDDSLLFQY